MVFRSSLCFFFAKTGMCTRCVLDDVEKMVVYIYLESFFSWAACYWYRLINSAATNSCKGEFYFVVGKMTHCVPPLDIDKWKSLILESAPYTPVSDL